jgi:DNA-binding transcriptional LysR family regulator
MKTLDGVFSSEISCFKVVFEQKGINGAARKIGQDPAHLSRLITRLEKRLGEKLFTRHSSGMSATRAGARLHSAITSALGALEARLVPDAGRETSIRIGFSPAVGYSHFSARVLPSLLALKAQPELHLAPTVELIELLKSRQLDFALIPSPLRFPGLVAQGLGTESVVVCSRTGAAARTLLLNPDLIGLEKIVPRLSYERRWVVRDYFVMAKFLEDNPGLMGILPEGLLGNFGRLRVVSRFPGVGKITALSYPGSIGLELLRELRRARLD